MCKFKIVKITLEQQSRTIVYNKIPGMDSLVQSRLNLGFNWVLNLANLGEPSEQVTQVSWVLEPSLPSLAGFIETLKTGF